MAVPHEISLQSSIFLLHAVSESCMLYLNFMAALYMNEIGSSMISKLRAQSETEENGSNMFIPWRELSLSINCWA